MNNLMMPQPQAQPPGPEGDPQPRTFSPEDIAAAHGNLGAIMKGLMDLSQKPRGSLSKQDVYNSVADMIGQGAFSTPQEKQAIVAQLAQMPDDEGALRQIIGQKLMRVAQAHEAIRHHYPMQE